MRHRKISLAYERELTFAGMREQQMIRQMLQVPAITAHILSKVLFYRFFGIHVQLLTETSIPVKMYNVLSSNGVCTRVSIRANAFVLSVCGMGM